MINYWNNTVSRDHVLLGMEGGFTQANHGRATNLKRLTKGDLIVFYSGRTSLNNGTPLQKFTAMARVIDDEPYQATMAPDFHPWRRRVVPLSSVEASIRPLIDQLTFIRDKQRWGFPFRRGLFPIPLEDFALLAQAMDVDQSIFEGVLS